MNWKWTPVVMHIYKSSAESLPEGILGIFPNYIGRNYYWNKTEDFRWDATIVFWLVSFIDTGPNPINHIGTF